ncbi:MAG: HAMP domain-containing protein [Caulobacteraceae bacterium]|nr:HAMP domain-containing protein [Caulobacteraceae bacterium]
MRPRLSSAPIFVQVLLLVVVSLVAAQVINLGVILYLPDPPPLGFSVQEAARALKGEKVVTARGQALKVREQATEPRLPVAAGHEPLGGLLAGLLSKELHVSPDRVRVGVIPMDVRIRHSMHAVEVTRTERPRGPDHNEVFIAIGPDAPGRPLRDPHAHPPGYPPVGETWTIRTEGMGQGLVFPPFAAALKQDDGRWLVLEPSRPLVSPWQLRTLVWFALSALVLAPLAWLIARRLARPIHTFAEAAERLGGDPNAPPLEEGRGPAEVRAAAAAFNDMQEKLKRYVQERTAMVAAIAHDLRTPLTRMRFRIEQAPEDVRDKVATDIEQMDAMVSQALTFVRGDISRGERVKLDLGALTQSVVDDLTEMGANVAFTGGALVVLGDPVGLRRLLSNLIENAVKFGARAQVSLERQGDLALVRIEDDGPGLPESEIERVFEPFHRADPSRSAATGGFGLGLSVARSIARGHNGEVSLENRPGGGLTATLRLPV